MDEQEAEALVFLQPDETAAQFFSRCHVEPLLTGLPLIDRHSPLRPSSFVEVAGLAGTGKTELLYCIAATCILPAQLNCVNYGGRASSVLFFDLDCKFDIVRLAQVLQSRVVAARRAAGLDPSGEGPEVVDIIRAACRRLRLVSCPTSFAFLAALKVSKPLVTSLMEVASLGAVLVDNVAAHVYTDRCVKGPVDGRQGAPLTPPRVHAAMAEGLKQLQGAYRVPVITTRHVLTTSGKGDPWEARDSMTKAWQEAVTQRLVLWRRAGSAGGAVQGQVEGVSRGHVCRWVKPLVPAEDEFVVRGDGIKVL